MSVLYSSDFDELLFDHTAITSPKYASASDNLIFNQSATQKIIIENVSNVLVLKQSVKNNVILAAANQRLILNQYAARRINLLIQDKINFMYQACRVMETYLYQAVPFYQQLSQHVGWNILTFNETLYVTHIKPGKDNLKFVESIPLHFSRVLLVNDTISFNSAATGFKINKAIILTPIPQPPSYFNKVTLSYGSYSIELPSPEFDNTDSIEQTRINRKSRSGDIRVFRSSLWPTDELLLMRWDRLSQTQITNLLAFLRFSLGQQIQLVDYESRVFDGIISEPSGDGSQPHRVMYSASITMYVIL